MKTGLIVEGGGQKGAYSAGVLDAMLEEGISFDYNIGVSAGAANLTSFVAGQYRRNYRFYRYHSTDNNYMGLKCFLKNGSVFNLHYIYGTLSNEGGKDPVDYEYFKNNPTTFKIVTTDAQTGKPVYIDKNQMEHNKYNALMASSAVPVFCKPEEIDGKLYFDGGVSDSIPVQKALEDGCDKMVVILSRAKGYIKQPEKHHRIYKRILKKFPKIVKDIDVRHIMYMKELRLAEKLEQEGKVIIIRPSEKLDVNTFSDAGDSIDSLYKLGISDFYAQIARIKTFIPSVFKNKTLEPAHKMTV
ncbi:MAG: patatin family protein [Treponema sp. CETP13]|nr:MAG: patatin family protein [Treponema sp. CETP13]